MSPNLATGASQSRATSSRWRIGPVAQHAPRTAPAVPTAVPASRVGPGGELEVEPVPYGALGVIPAALLSRTGGTFGGCSSRMSAGGDKAAHTWGRLDRLGLRPLTVLPDFEWAYQPGAGEVLLAKRLRESVEARVRASTKPEKLGTTLSYVERFTEQLPSRPLFMARGGLNDAAAATFNAETMSMLAEFIRLTGSIRPGHIGERLAADTIGDYCGTFMAAVNTTTHGRLTLPAFDTRRYKQQKHMLREDGPKASGNERARRLGFRGHMLLQVVQSNFDRLSVVGTFRWTVALTTYCCVMRPGEPGMGKAKVPFDPKRGLTVANVVLWEPHQTQNGRHAIVAMIVPSKDQTGRASRRPCPIAARHEGREPASDPMCVYSLLLTLWRARKAAVCRRPGGCTAPDCCADCLAAPLFVWPGSGRCWTSQDGLEVVRDMAVAIGVDPADYTGYSLRIAAASDICDQYGEEKGSHIVTRRGRWGTDISFIYRRNTAADQLEASVIMSDAKGLEMEALLPGWSQPTTNWGRRAWGSGT